MSSKYETSYWKPTRDELLRDVTEEWAKSKEAAIRRLLDDVEIRRELCDHREIQAFAMQLGIFAGEAKDAQDFLETYFWYLES